MTFIRNIMNWRATYWIRPFYQALWSLLLQEPWKGLGINNSIKQLNPQLTKLALTFWPNKSAGRLKVYSSKLFLRWIKTVRNKWVKVKASKSPRIKMSACSPHLWCTIEPRWFPTGTRQKRKTISRRATIWYHIWKQIHKNTRRRDERTRTVRPICCVGVWPTAGGGLRQHGNQACECFNQSHSERESQKLGQRLLVLNWILTGSRE